MPGHALATAVATTPKVASLLRSPGHPRDRSARSYLEPRFGHDFSHVRVHTDAAAHAVGARAYPVGHQIAFGAAHRPGTDGYVEDRRHRRIQTVIHECGHLCGLGFGPGQDVYSQEKRFEQLSPDVAVQNPDSYAMFCLELPAAPRQGRRR
jgi:Domain of unknown function (DUF4157)